MDLGVRNEAPSFVVTGCARSGTTYLAELFTALEIPCGHEDVFTPATSRFPGFGNRRGDSSWLAVPFLDQLPPDTLVIHVVREPSAVIRSLVATKFFASGSRLVADAFMAAQVARSVGARGMLRRLDPRRGRRLRRDFVAFARTHCPDAFEEPTETARAARYWIDWNDRAAAADDTRALRYERLQIEDLDAARMNRLLQCLGSDVSISTVARALAAVPQTINHRPGKGALEELPARLVSELREAATRFGYAEPVPAW